MKRRAMFMLVLLIGISLSPIASGATNETQFADGTTTFSHSFTAGNGGDAQTPGVTLPYGAAVTDARFVVEGTAQNTQWENRTTNADFGGVGEGSTSFTGSYFSSWYRNGLNVNNDEMTLRTQETTNTNNLAGSSSWDSSSSSYHNQTGRFAANGDRGYVSPTIHGTEFNLPSTMGWSTTSGANGAVVLAGDTLFTTRYTSSSIYSTPDINSYNTSTTNTNRVTVSYGTCSSCLLYTSPSPRDRQKSRMPSSA